MSALPVAQVVEVVPPERRLGTWRVVVECPFCRDRRGRPGRHLHAVLGPGDEEFPLLRSRAADCGVGDYLVGALPACFPDLVRTLRGWRAKR